jgi:hypothetical protein
MELRRSLLTHRAQRLGGLVQHGGHDRPGPGATAGTLARVRAFPSIVALIALPVD